MIIFLVFWAMVTLVLGVVLGIGFLVVYLLHHYFILGIISGLILGALLVTIYIIRGYFLACFMVFIGMLLD